MATAKIVETIPEVHIRLNYAHYEPRLRAVKGLWAQLQKLKANPAAYTRALEQHIAVLRRREAAEAPLADADCDQAWSDISALWSRLYDESRALAQMRLPSDIEAWMEKWDPKTFQGFTQAKQAWIERPSSVTSAAFKKAIAAFFDAYNTAV